MASEWPIRVLADICDSVDYGYTASAKEVPCGPKFLRITDIVSGSVNWDSVPYCEIDQSAVSRFRLDAGDVVIARTGATTGYSAYIADPPYAVFASYLVRLKVGQDANSQFISYFLKSPPFWDYMRGVLGDKSAQPNASAKTMTQVMLPLPPLKEQQAIACILGALDDKIELNRRMNETLEAMARAIFKSWFVDFDAVRAKAAGQQPSGLSPHIADLFPDEFEESELGEIPRGWEVRGLDEIAHFLNGLALQKYPPQDDRWLPVIKIAQLRKGNTIGADHASADLAADYVVEDGDVLFSWSGSLECALWAGGKGALNQHLFKVTSVAFPKWFYYLWIHEHLLSFRHIAAGKATTMGHIQRHHLSDAKVVVPGQDVLAVANNTLSPIIGQIVQRRIESCTLAALRDTLLPRLISGELRVPDAKRFMEART